MNTILVHEFKPIVSATCIKSEGRIKIGLNNRWYKMNLRLVDMTWEDTIDGKTIINARFVAVEPITVQDANRRKQCKTKTMKRR